MSSAQKKNKLLNVVSNSLVELPTPSNISAFWNFGSLLGLCLGVQILSGVILSLHYTGDVGLAFQSVTRMFSDAHMNWWVRCLHANGASFFFLALYLHIGRGLYYGSFYFSEVWNLGVVILLLVMATAFLGYVLPWGQMSFWGATVITSLFSAIPFIGSDVVLWIWGGFSVDNSTLTRFFGLHFLLPFVVSGVVILHLFFLHVSGSGNPLGVNSNFNKVRFHLFFTLKDLFGFLVMLGGLSYFVFYAPWVLGDSENFIKANPLVTPVHIQPEWYFLFAYAILRSIPSKLGGVVALAGSVLVLFALPLFPRADFRGLAFYPANKLLFASFLGVFALLTWLGMRPVEEPFIFTGQVASALYFGYFMFYWGLQKGQDRAF
uniref:Cytochrome b n=1 Tax=Tigriopus kingsejongensis TaxID=1133412 RepID=A0A650DDU3_9MAXI|nr:cytochrome b [Tigriopus kingsejongensis]